MLANFAAAFFYFTFPKIAAASVDQENGVTLLQLLVGAFVLGWFAWRHFKGSIKNLSKNLFSKHKEEKKTED
jgi:hypothetical protein